MSGQTKQQPKAPKKRNPRRRKAGKGKSAVSTLTGPASTTIVAPVAQTVQRVTARPRINRSTKNGDVVVEHREYIQDINGSVAFLNAQLAVNPGLASVFPWLSQLASMYESYKFEKLHFEFLTEASTSSTGTVMMAIDYDASDPAPISKQQLATYRGFVRTAPWSAMTYKAIREDLSKRQTYYVRSGGLSANQDIKLYDVGNLNIATAAQASTALVGELYVCYRVKLSTPQANGSNFLSGKVAFATGLSGALVLTGNAPVTVTNTATTVVVTANAPYTTLIALNHTGTTLGAPSVSFAGGTTGSNLTFNVNAGTTSASYAGNFTLPTGGSLTITLPNATSSSVVVELAQYNISN